MVPSGTSSVSPDGTRTVYVGVLTTSPATGPVYATGASDKPSPIPIRCRAPATQAIDRARAVLEGSHHQTMHVPGGCLILSHACRRPGSDNPYAIAEPGRTTSISRAVDGRSGQWTVCETTSRKQRGGTSVVLLLDCPPETMTCEGLIGITGDDVQVNVFDQLATRRSMVPAHRVSVGMPSSMITRCWFR